MTSFVFEYLAIIAPAKLWSIIKEACNIYDNINPGDLIDVDFWPSWPDSRDEEWIKKTFENKHTYISSHPVNSKDSIFIANIVPIGNLTSEKLIEDELQNLNKLYTEKVAEKCGCTIKSVFNVD